MQFVIPSAITTTRNLGDAYLAPGRVAPDPSPKTLWFLTGRAARFVEDPRWPLPAGGHLQVWL